MVHINNGILLSHKKEQNNVICSDTDGPRDYHIKWNKSHKYMISCGILKNDTNELTDQIEIDS